MQSRSTTSGLNPHPMRQSDAQLAAAPGVRLPWTGLPLLSASSIPSCCRVDNKARRRGFLSPEQHRWADLIGALEAEQREPDIDLALEQPDRVRDALLAREHGGIQEGTRDQHEIGA